MSPGAGRRRRARTPAGLRRPRLWSRRAAPVAPARSGCASWPGRFARRIARRQGVAQRDRADHRLDRLARGAAGTQQGRRRGREIEHGRFERRRRTARHRGSSRRGRRAISATCSARVGLTAPLRLAEGAASGRPTARISACAIGCAGARTATVSSPAVASSAIGESLARGSTRVSGPGQKCAASLSAVSVTLAAAAFSLATVACNSTPS